MGRIPLGKANKMTSVDAISSLVLAGVSVFVSLMLEDEEALVEQSLGLEPCRDSIESAVVKARIALIKIISENDHIIQEHSKIIDRLSDVTKQSPNYEKINRDRLKSLARIRLANEAISRAKEHMKRLPQEFEWMRAPISPFDVPDAPWLEQQLVVIENKMLQGKVVYVYSHEGHGRCGVIASCLLGRLYGLTANDALYRVQACHDCMHSEVKRSQVVHCPQLPLQRNLVTEILGSTNRHFDGTLVRSAGALDHAEEVIQRGHVRGTPLGVYSEVIEKKATSLTAELLSTTVSETAAAATAYLSTAQLETAARPLFKLLRQKREAL